MPVDRAPVSRVGLAALTRTDGLGGYKVLAQGKGLQSSAVGLLELWGFAPRPEAPDLVRNFTIPLLATATFPCLRARAIA